MKFIHNAKIGRIVLKNLTGEWRRLDITVPPPPPRSEINNAIDASKPCLGIVASGWSSMPRQRQIQRGRELSKPGGS